MYRGEILGEIKIVVLLNPGVVVSDRVTWVPENYLGSEELLYNTWAPESYLGSEELHASEEFHWSITWVPKSYMLAKSYMGV